MFQNPYEIQENQQLSLMGQRLEGEVVAHHPDKNGMVRIRLRNLHDDWPEDCLPWQQADTGFGSGNDKVGQVFPIPPIGAKTYSRFLSDNQFHPVYTAGGASSSDRPLDGLINDPDYPNKYGAMDWGGHKEVVNTAEGKEDWTRSHVKGASMNLDKDGNINHMSPAAISHIADTLMMLAKSGLQLGSAGDGHMKFGGNLIIEAMGTLEFRHNGAKTSQPIMPGAAGPSSQSAPTLPQAGQRPQLQAPGQDI